MADGDLDLVTDAVLTASRALVGVAARSLAVVDPEVTLPQYRALVVLASRGPRLVGELAEALGIHPSTATRLCDRLVVKKLVTRTTGRDNRRETTISLSVKGRRLVDRVTVLRRREIEAIVERVPSDLWSATVAALARVRGGRRRAAAAGVGDWAGHDRCPLAAGVPSRRLARVRQPVPRGRPVVRRHRRGDRAVRRRLRAARRHRNLRAHPGACRPGSSRCCQVSACWSRSPHAGSSAGASSSATADEYLQAFHDAGHPLGLRAFVARTLAGLATLGSGGPMGLEGPSLYAGAVFGSNLQRRLPRMFRNADRRVLLVAGAAAGVAAIFKAPATGAVFALEVPYQDDLARNMLPPGDGVERRRATWSSSASTARRRCSRSRGRSI